MFGKVLKFAWNACKLILLVIASVATAKVLGRKTVDSFGSLADEIEKRWKKEVVRA